MGAGCSLEHLSAFGGGLLLFFDEEVEGAGLVEVTGDEFAVGAVAGEEVYPGRAPDHAAGVLVEHEAAEGLPAG